MCLQHTTQQMLPLGYLLQAGDLSRCLHESESEVTQSCWTLWDPMDCSLPGSSLHGILQAKILEWVAISLSRGSSQLRDRARVSCTAGRCFNLRDTREAQVPPHITIEQTLGCWRRLSGFFYVPADVSRAAGPLVTKGGRGVTVIGLYPDSAKNLKENDDFSLGINPTHTCWV